MFCWDFFSSSFMVWGVLGEGKGGGIRFWGWGVWVWIDGWIVWYFLLLFFWREIEREKGKWSFVCLFFLEREVVGLCPLFF